MQGKFGKNHENSEPYSEPYFFYIEKLPLQPTSLGRCEANLHIWRENLDDSVWSAFPYLCILSIFQCHWPEYMSHLSWIANSENPIQMVRT